MLGIGMAQIKVYSLSENAFEYPYWVIRIVDGAAWFYGAHRNRDQANKQALEVDGAVVENKEVQS